MNNLMIMNKIINEVIIVNCDRCKKPIQDASIVEAVPGVAFTCGYYNLEGYWKKYANEGETVICDTCMHLDPKYQEDYK